MTIQMKVTEQYFLGVLYKGVSGLFVCFLSFNETLQHDHLNESFWAGISRGAVYFALQGGSKCQCVRALVL